MQTTAATITTQQFASATTAGVVAAASHAHAHLDSTNHYASSSDSRGNNFQRKDSHMHGQLNSLDQRMPARWNKVEPWNTLLCREGGEGGDAESTDEGRRRSEDLQERKLAAVVLDEHEEGSISQDVRRTRSNTPVFRDEAARDWLQRCVALFCQERGLEYVQGLSELAAPWALITEPPSFNAFSYRCFSSFVDRFAPYLFSTTPGEGGQKTFVVLESHLELLDQLLWYHDPALAVHMQECRLHPDAYATSWFITMFARQTPIPVLLVMWQRLVEYRDPVLHQFLALAWLLSNRRLLLETSRDDVPERLTKLRVQSTKAVERVLAFALELRRATPRWFSNTLRAVCYEDEGGNGVGNGYCSTRRASLLGDIKVTGMVLVGADQVAEILLSAGSSAKGSDSREPDGTSENGGRGGIDERNAAAVPGDKDKDWGASGLWDRWILVDCRPSTVTSSSDAQAAVAALSKAFGGVVWRRINPAKCLGKESVAISDILREFAAGTGREEGIDGGARGVSDRSRSGNGETFSTAPPQSERSVETHMCFIGVGGRGAETEAGDVELRLARYAARSCLISQVCVLEGGFSAFDEALRTRREEMARGPASAGGVSSAPSVAKAVETLTMASTPTNRQGVAVEAVVFPESATESEAYPPEPNVGVSVGSGYDAEKRESDEDGNIAAGPSTTPAAEAMTPSTAVPPVVENCPSAAHHLLNPAEDSEVPVPPVALTTPANSFENTETEEGGVPMPPRFVTTPIHTIEKMSRLANSNRVSQPFRVYASKSADEMGHALRSLPAAAEKPLEDAARVCSSLAKANVKVVGESRVSLSRSLTHLEQLDSRMGGTAAGFARHFGAGGRR